MSPVSLTRDELRAVCGSTRWVDAMLNAGPFSSMVDVHRRAQEAWRTLGREDWLEAFAAHPRIGDAPGDRNARAASADDTAGLAEARFARRRDASWSRSEQLGMKTATGATRRRLAELNGEYERRFGYIFIICASGRGAGEMLAALEERLSHTAEEELPIAAAEQANIIRLRLEKLCQP